MRAAVYVLVRRLLTPITPGARRAVVMLFVLSLAVGGASILYSVHYANSLQAAQKRQAAATQAAERRQGQLIEQKLCTTLGKLAALKPPPGSPRANPSRGYDQELHTALAQLGPDIGCSGRP